MKNFIFFFCMLFIFACGTESTQEKIVETATSISKATLSGTITNPKGAIVKLSNGDDKFEADVVDGKFTMEITLDKAGYYNFRHGSESTSMYIEPDDAISLTLNPKEFDESISYAGKGAEESNYLAGKYMLNEKEMGETKDFFSQTEEDFIQSLAEVKAKAKNNFKQFLKDHPDANADFISNEKINLLYEWANHRNNYQHYYQHYTDNDDFLVSENYNDYLKELELDNGDLLSSKTYKKFLKGHYTSLADLIQEEDESLKEDKKTGKMKAKFAAIQQFVKDPAIKSFLTFGTLKDQIRYKGVAGVESFLVDFKKNSNNEEENKELQELFDKWSALALGNTAPNFDYADIEGKLVGLKDFKGKNVYVDVWATWCAPCKREIPHLEELEKKYKGNDNIVFTSVSIDADKEAWEKMVKEKEMVGVQLIADKAWDSSICKDYLINGIPRFILIDRAGKIIDAKAPRPSSDEIKGILEDLSKPLLTSMK